MKEQEKCCLFSVVWFGLEGKGNKIIKGKEQFNFV